MKKTMTEFVLKPIDKLKSGSVAMYDRYRELFKSIRRLARPQKIKEKAVGKG